ncbi:uncharacterized protein LOC105227957 isoform X4 [Bactrocera dorsalis]|uniref:Uncharacterized protein LOC105227957 isoform X4 n=1 Tax=Bactrocera dorsalis TaxID=27457 RepID=A0ABM3K3K6_BACDO|nr:uncharacterized protein LOC105227957 isoform X4 [Bactrocera dorsalis]
MTDHYIRELLRTVVAQICQTIGYHVVQTTPFELLQDILQRFLHEFSRDLRRQVEHYNRTEACLDDIYITLRNLNINISELLDYTNNVEPVPLAVELPKFPAHKNTNLNFLKPGSKEVLIRPVHIHEYLPPMLPADSKSTLPSHYLHSDSPFFKSSSINVSNDCETKTERYLPTFANTVTCMSTPNGLGVSKDSLDPSQEGANITLCSSSHMFDEEGRPTREISSVVMTTGGFISPAIEGKLPDTKVPKFVEKLMGLDAPPPTSPAAVVSSEKFRTAEHKHHSNNTTPKAGVSEAVHTCTLQSKPLLNVEKIKLVDGVASQLLATSSKHMIANENVSDITNISVIKKAGWSPLTRHVQVPTIATKLLNKAKKKSPLDLQSALIAKTYLPNAENSNTSLISPRVENSERLHKKTKKMLLNLLKPGLESSSISSDYSNSVLQRHKMEKYLKKQSKHKKRILHKQKQGDVLKNLEIAKVLGDELPVPQPSSTKTLSNISVIKESFLPEASKEKTCAPKASLSDVSPLFSQCSATDNSCSVKNTENDAVDNVKLSLNATSLEKKILSGVKLSTELDKNKLNIFKKISKQKSQKPASPNSRVPSTQLSGGNDVQFINLPCGTTITPTPTNLKCMIASDTNVHNSDQLEKKSKVSVNCERGAAGLVENISANSITDVIIPNQISQLPLQISEGTKPKKRGRKPGSKNLPKQTIVSPIGSSDVSHTKKMKKLKASKYDQQHRPHLETKLSMELINPVDNMTPTLCCGSDAITSSLSLNIKDIRKERKKNKTKNLILNMSMNEPNEYNAEKVFPTKEEVNTINKKLMRMDTILQPLGLFNDAMVDPNSDIIQTSSHKPLPYKSPTNRKRLSPQIPLQLHTIPSLMHGAHQSFTPKPAMGGIPDLLKLCPFPSGPGLIPHTAQNMLFPRLLPTFHLPIPNLRQQSAAKPINIESSISGTSLEPSLFQASAERNYCNVPPFVPESMKLTSPEVISETRKAERECPKTPKLQHSTTVSEKILNTPELWSTPETSSKSVPPTPGGMSLNTYELHLQNDRATESPKSNADNPVFVGTTSILNAEDPIELSDDSIEYSTIMLNSLSSTNSKDLHQNQLQLPTKSLNFSQIEDYVPIRKDITKELSGDLYLSSKDPKMFQKANKLLKTTKNFLPTEPENLSQIDIFSSEKHGVGKLAGGADLIPLISTGSAYSAKTIPSTSLTATVAAPFTLSKKDIYSTNAFENSLLSANITDNEFLCVSNELQRKKKDHKKLKKLRDDKTKKKKDKKSKCKERTDHHENVVNRNEKSLKEKQKDSLRCDEEQQLVNKDLLKKLKKEKKKKNKQLFTEELVQTVKKHATDTPGISGVGKPTTMFSMFSTSTNLSATTNLSSSTESFVPKLTLKLGNSQSPTPDEDTSHKKYFSTSKTLNEFERKREPSPELARISPLVTRPQKQKFNLAAETLISASNQIAVSGGSGNSAFDSINESKVSTVSASKNPCVHSGASSPSPWSSGATLSASSVLLPQQLLRPLKSQEPLLLSSKVDRGLLPNSNINISHSLDVAARHSPVPLISETSRPSSYIDAEGNRVWICPACGKVDDGSPMIGCDGCDAWYHWICVGITIAPKDNEDWFCRVCITRKKGIHATDKKRKRSKKK